MANIQVPNLAAQVSALSLRPQESKELNYDVMDYKSAVYKLRQIQQNNGGSAITLSANSTTQSLFNIPNETFNLARSYITLDMKVDGNATPNFGNVHFTDSLPIDNLKFKPSSGDPVVQVDNAQVYTKFSQAAVLGMNEYLSRDSVYADTAIGTAFPISECSGCQPQQVPSTQVTLQILASVPSKTYLVGSTNLVSETPSNQTSGTTNDEKTPQRLVAGAFTGNAGTGATTIRYHIPLAAFSGTALAVNRSVCYGQIMQLYINWAPFSRWGFCGLNTAAVPTLLAAPTVSNLYLYLANDISISGREIMALANSSGLQLSIPYLECTSYTPAAAGVNSVPYTLNPGTGTLLKRVMVVVANSTNTLGTTAQIDNVGGARFSTVQSYLDSKPLQDYQMLISDSTLWQYMKPMIKSSPAGLDQRNYLINCFYLDNFSDCNESVEWPENDLKMSGLSIDQTRNYAVKMTTTATSIVLLFAVWSRNLIIRPNGISRV
jgi:hypothetical protein